MTLPKTIARAGLVAPVLMCLLTCTTLGQGTRSMCLTTNGDCETIGSKIDVSVQLGQTGPTVVGGQFTIDYDPAVFEFLSLNPGNNCDAQSPFEFEIIRNVDDSIGRIFYAVGVTPGDLGTSQPSTLACLSFQVRQVTQSDICLVFASNSPRISDAMGASVTIDNSVSCPPSALEVSCVHVQVEGLCQCGTKTPDCGAFTEMCRRGICDTLGQQCIGIPDHQGLACDDGDSCTQSDQCEGGLCLGNGCPNPSVCLASDPGCFAFGTTIVRVLLGEGDPYISGAQFEIHYDPSALEFIESNPGSYCDPASPFSFELEEDLVEPGRITTVVGVDPIGGGGGTQGPATLACLTFAVLGTSTTEVCAATMPQGRILTDEDGQVVPVDNSEDCASGVEFPLVACTNVDLDEDCKCSGDGDCAVLSNTCRRGYCDVPKGICKTVPINEGQACDDGEDCTEMDRCMSGVCRGINCENPSLCVETQPECLAPGLTTEVRIRMGESSRKIVGAQFTVQYDQLNLQFLEIVPGNSCDTTSPFVLELTEIVNPIQGEIFYAVGVAIGAMGTNGPDTLACIRFRVLGPSSGDVCLIHDVNPRNTLLVDDQGQSVGIYNAVECPSDQGFPIISCNKVCVPVPTLSEWGLVFMTMLLWVASRRVFR